MAQPVDLEALRAVERALGEGDGLCEHVWWCEHCDGFSTPAQRCGHDRDERSSDDAYSCPPWCNVHRCTHPDCGMETPNDGECSTRRSGVLCAYHQEEAA